MVNGISYLYPLNNFQVLLGRVSKMGVHTVQAVMKEYGFVDYSSIRARVIENSIVLLFRAKCSVHVPDLLASLIPVP